MSHVHVRLFALFDSNTISNHSSVCNTHRCTAVYLPRHACLPHPLFAPTTSLFPLSTLYCSSPRYIREDALFIDLIKRSWRLFSDSAELTAGEFDGKITEDSFENMSTNLDPAKTTTGNPFFDPAYGPQHEGNDTASHFTDMGAPSAVLQEAGSPPRLPAQ